MVFSLGTKYASLTAKIWEKRKKSYIGSAPGLFTFEADERDFEDEKGREFFLNKLLTMSSYAQRFIVQFNGKKCHRGKMLNSWKMNIFHILVNYLNEFMLVS